MNNKEIASVFSLLAKLMELHGENSFKVKAYATAAFRIKKLSAELSKTDLQTLAIPGIGDTILQKLQTIIETGSLPLLNEYLAKTPKGVVEMLLIKGIGAKKVALLWQDLGIESLGELAYSCQENRLITLKGFGEKTQIAILENIRFIQKHKGDFLYAEIETSALAIQDNLLKHFPNKRTEITGAFRRQLPVLDKIEYLTEITPSEVKKWLQEQKMTFLSEAPEKIEARLKESIKMIFHCTNSSNFAGQLFSTTNHKEFAEAFFKKYEVPKIAFSENNIFNHNHLAFLPAALRENKHCLKMAEENKVPNLIQLHDIKGVIHCHSKYSDGLNSLEDMAIAAKKKGFEYMVISDHSQSAVYAQGLKLERVKAQHDHIDKLNIELAPFRIFKGIESDILSDGNLDYEASVLSSFEVVIASVHSNLKMDEEKAMKRLLKAIENPYTTILGHPTGRLLLSRPGYPLRHKKLIEACVANNVVIEVNAHPQRLDLDWQWIPYALEKGLTLSINPDAHSIDGMDLVKYGVLVAQKGGLTAFSNLSSKTLSEFCNYLTLKE